MYYWFKAVVKCGYKGNANFWNSNKKNENNDEKNIFRDEIVFFWGVSVAEICKKEKVIMVFERDEPTMSKIFSKFVSF